MAFALSEKSRPSGVAQVVSEVSMLYYVIMPTSSFFLLCVLQVSGGQYEVQVFSFPWKSPQRRDPSVCGTESWATLPWGTRRDD